MPSQSSQREWNSLKRRWPKIAATVQSLPARRPEKPHKLQVIENQWEKSGGQPGHKGTSVAQVENPDCIVVHSVSTCGGCGLSLEGIAAHGLEKRQVFDLPPLNLIVTEHQAEQKSCACGCITTAVFRRRRQRRCSMVLGAIARCLHERLPVPAARQAQRLFLELFGLGSLPRR